ncbi:MAG: alpha/beta fold hydrolase [Propionibacteriaceae bacterium]
MTTRTLFLLHGAGQNPPVWQDVVTGVGPDRPLHAPWLRGLKPTDARGFDIAGAVADLVSVMELRDLDVVDVCGTGLGGMVALRFAADEPARVGRLVLVDTPVVPPRTTLRVQRAMLKLAPAKSFAPGVSKETMLAGIDAMMSLDLSTDLRRIQSPTTVVAAAGNKLSIAAADLLVKGIVGAQIETVDGAANDVVRESPRELAEILDRVLGPQS